jgi:hypothetical protein
MKQCMNETMHETMHETMIQSTNRPTNDESISRSINQPINQAINHPTNQSNTQTLKTSSVALKLKQTTLPVHAPRDATVRLNVSMRVLYRCQRSGEVLCQARRIIASIIASTATLANKSLLVTLTFTILALKILEIRYVLAKSAENETTNPNE